MLAILKLIDKFEISSIKIIQHYGKLIITYSWKCTRNKAVEQIFATK